MRSNVQVKEIREMGQRMIDILGLEGSPIGVRLLTPDERHWRGQKSSNITGTARR